MEQFLKLGTVLLSFVIVFSALEKNEAPTPQSTLPNYSQFDQDTTPETFEIKTKVPGHLSYDDVIEQLNEWEKESSAMSSVGTYGKSSRGKDLYFFRTGTEGRPKVLITACIHGNEP